MHQLSPYIGKLKSTIAHDLVAEHSRKGDLVVEPFAGAGTVPLESVLQGRRAFAADISPYSACLCRAKLSAPLSLSQALAAAERALREAQTRPLPDLRRIPAWVRQFFHPQTLKEAIRFAEVCERRRDSFLMACFLGILHHQRPGFLSYPSSHLVPYLRDRAFPRAQFPGFYEYRELRPRLIAKIRRAYRRHAHAPHGTSWQFRKSSVQNLTFPRAFDCVITSPPYMNALDYGRDNRLRLWFLNPRRHQQVDNPVTQQRLAFEGAMDSLASKIQYGLRRGGHCVFVVGEQVARSFDARPSETICRIMATSAPSIQLRSIIRDEIPDIRRSRRATGATKAEHILIFQRADHA